MLRLASLLTLACALGACSGPQTAAEAVGLEEKPFVTVAVLPLAEDLVPGASATPSPGHDIYRRLFDLLLADATTDVVLQGTRPEDLAPADAGTAAPTGPLLIAQPDGALRLQRAVTVRGRRPDLLVVLRGLRFSDQFEDERSYVGSVADGRSLLGASASFVVFDNRTRETVRRGTVEGSAVIARGSTGAWQNYVSALGDLARDLARAARLGLEASA